MAAGEDDDFTDEFLRRLEALHGGLGVMADDAMAAVYANVSLRILLMLFPGWIA